MIRNVLLVGGLLYGVMGLGVQTSLAQEPHERIYIEDFEGYEAGDPPYHWKRPHKNDRTVLELPRTLTRDNDYFEIVEEDGQKRGRIFTRDDTEQVVRLNGDGYRWSLRTHPRLAWSWRAERLPEGAREDKARFNDTGAALYVTFGSRDWLGRPRTIKYTYSSTLPVGTTARYGALRLIVVSSALDAMGTWLHIERDVAADYERLFGHPPPDAPGYIMLWGDSDTTHGLSDVYFDDLVALPRDGS